MMYNTTDMHVTNIFIVVTEIWIYCKKDFGGKVRSAEIRLYRLMYRIGEYIQKPKKPNDGLYIQDVISVTWRVS